MENSKYMTRDGEEILGWSVIEGIDERVRTDKVWAYDGETPMKTVNLTPAGFEGAEGQKNVERANKAIDSLNTANADYANKMEEIFSVIGKEQFPDLLRSFMGREDAKDYLDDLEAINKRRDAAREEMLRAVAGAPALPA